MLGSQTNTQILRYRRFCDQLLQLGARGPRYTVNLWLPRGMTRTAFSHSRSVFLTPARALATSRARNTCTYLNASLRSHK